VSEDAKPVKANDLYRLGPVPLGVGGYAEVFPATERSTGSEVALKRTKPGTEAAARIRREIRAQQLLAPHPNIMPVLNRDPGYTWYTMPVAEGNLSDLRALIDEDELASLLSNIADALDVAHVQELVHRDISPNNILALPGSGTNPRRWVVADWGMVTPPADSTGPRWTKTGVAIGTEGFAAPELIDNPSGVTGAADVYSLGRVAAWFLTGILPRSGQALLPDGEMMHWRMFVKGCTEYRVAQRIPDMTSFRHALRNVFNLIDEPPAVRAKTLVERILQGETSMLDVLISVAAAHQDDEKIYIDDLARVPGALLRSFVAASPEQAAEIASQMAWHLTSSPWGDRDREYAGTPLGFVHTILQALVQEKNLGYAQDVATKFFAADAHWKHVFQRQRTMDWLATLEGPADVTIAQALNRPELREYYSGIRPQSAVLTALFRSAQ
jgi:serine/threonine protein kinase